MSRGGRGIWVLRGWVDEDGAGAERRLRKTKGGNGGEGLLYDGLSSCPGEKPWCIYSVNSNRLVYQTLYMDF